MCENVQPGAAPAERLELLVEVEEAVIRPGPGAAVCLGDRLVTLKGWVINQKVVVNLEYKYKGRLRYQNSPPAGSGAESPGEKTLALSR